MRDLGVGQSMPQCYPLCKPRSRSKAISEYVTNLQGAMTSLAENYVGFPIE